MQIAKIENGQVVEIKDYRQMFNNIAFPSSGPSDQWLSDNSCKKVSLFKDHDRNTQKLVTVDPYVEGDWVYTVEVVDMTAEEIQAKADADIARKEKNIRDQRDRLLAESDWVTIKALETNALIPSDWAAYRQALRDITDHENFPYLTEADWPTKPE